RFWPVVTGIWGSLALYISGRLLFNRRTGIVGAAVLATSVLYYGAAHYANLDLEVGVLISSTLLSFLLGLKASNPTRSKAWIYIAYIFAGLAVLTKGLIGIAFPMMIVGSFCFITRDWSIFKKLRLLTGPLLTLVIILPWYILAQQANHEFFHFFFIVQQISRFLSTNDFNNQVAWWFYIPIVLAGFLPWTFFLPSMFIKNLQDLRKSVQQHQAVLYLMLWVTLIFIFFSIPRSKTIGYILPVFPGLALLTGHFIDQCWGTFTSRRRFTLLLLPLAFTLFALACFIAPQIQALHIAPALIPNLKLAGIILSISALVLFYFVYRKNFLGFFGGAILSTLAFFFVLVNSAAIINENSIKPLALELKTIIKPEDEVASFYKHFQDLPLYLERRITIVADWEDPNIEHNDNWLRELWYGKSFQDTKDWLISEKTFWLRWNSAKTMYALVHQKYFNTFKAKAGNRLHLINQYNETVLITNS
ncbi:MAG TPA: glycosyltransferase family 39 protein, partial [Gammaproteobacteria bacterium]|nr:glycosyltransferase family 39 protein [Gammaproteobacteria bacterium]